MQELKDMINSLRNGNEPVVMTEEEYSNQQAKAYNDIAGNLNLKDGVECKTCKNKGYVMYSKYNEMYKGYTEVMRECDCMKRRRIIMKAQLSGLGEYLKYRPKDFIATDDWQKENKKLMAEYCQSHADDDTWFAAIGQSGAGKTMLGSIIANYLLYEKKKNVVYITWTDFIRKVKSDMMGDKSNEVSSYLEDIKNIEVLFIDELLKKYNETDLKYIIEIINYRYTNNLKTIITSERVVNELLDIDEATFSRVIEKCNDFIINIDKDRSKNYRLKKIK